MPHALPFKLALALAALCPCSAFSVTPVEKVINLLTDLQKQVQDEGTQEAATYDDFACFCKTTTAAKSTAITDGRDSIETLSADIQEKTATKAAKSSELAGRQKDEQAWTKELDDERVRCAKLRAEYEAKAADLSKAISSLESAMQSMENSKPASFLAVPQSIEQSLALADSLHLIAEPTKKEVRTFLQTQAGVDPSDPEYKYRSQGIIDVLQKLLNQFTAEKEETDKEWGTTETACGETISSFETLISENSDAMDVLTTDIDQLKGEIATSRESLVTAESTLTDDQLYLKDLTERCEVRAKDWDQRSHLRADELAALAGALTVLQDDVKERDIQVNNRTLLIERGVSSVGHRRFGTASAVPATLVQVSRHLASPSFLQEAAIGHGLLRGGHTGALLLQARQLKVEALLQSEAQRLQSSVLTALAAQVAADPFAKVKTLIQKLIERLLSEATAEATKKGFCDEQLGKASKDRDFRLADTQRLDLEIKALKVKVDELQVEIQRLTEALEELRGTLETATTNRGLEKENNLNTVKVAKEGLVAIKEAITILKVFYRRGAKASVLLQASPVDEDTAGAGFSGAYQGQQESSKGIIGMLEVIESDFDRTIRVTESAEKKAHEEFVEFERVSKADISAKDTQLSLNEEEVTKTINTMDKKVIDLTTAQKLLDDALRVFENLKPTCIDTAMLYEERAAKRQEEIDALRRAVCILDTQGVEADCGQR